MAQVSAGLVIRLCMLLASETRNFLSIASSVRRCVCYTHNSRADFCAPLYMHPMPYFSRLPISSC